MIIDICTTFYRYDLVQPPTSWCSSFKNNSYSYNGLGNKNAASLFFFTDSIETAHQLGRGASNECKTSGYYLTCCPTNSPIRILDFSNCCSIYHMLCTLKDNEIDVLNEIFKTYMENEESFLSLKGIFDNAEKEKDDKEKISLITKLNYFILKNSPHTYMDNMSLFGQRLTDFNNGINLKKILEEKGIEGYKWREFEDNFTICLMNSSKLTNPSTKFISV